MRIVSSTKRHIVEVMNQTETILLALTRTLWEILEILVVVDMFKSLISFDTFVFLSAFNFICLIITLDFLTWSLFLDGIKDVYLVPP